MAEAEEVAALFDQVQEWCYPSTAPRHGVGSRGPALFRNPPRDVPVKDKEEEPKYGVGPVQTQDRGITERFRDPIREVSIRVLHGLDGNENPRLAFGGPADVEVLAPMCPETDRPTSHIADSNPQSFGELTTPEVLKHGDVFGLRGPEIAVLQWFRLLSLLPGGSSRIDS